MQAVQLHPNTEERKASQLEKFYGERYVRKLGYEICKRTREDILLETRTITAPYALRKGDNIGERL